jgi:hypothetical protein
VSVSAIGKVQAFNAQAEHARRTTHDAAQDDEEISPVAWARKPGASRGHRNPPVTIDLRPDPPAEITDDAAQKARRYTLGGGASHDGGGHRRRAPEAAPEPPWTYRANPDTPYRRRSSEETYQAVETVDTPVPHRGGIYDRRV